MFPCSFVFQRIALIYHWATWAAKYLVPWYIFWKRKTKADVVPLLRVICYKLYPVALWHVIDCIDSHFKTRHFSCKATKENLSPHSLILCVLGVSHLPCSHARPAIYFQVPYSHSFYGKWLRWPFWPHRTHIMVLLLKTPLTTITLKGRQGRLLRAGSMPAKSTKGCVRDDTAADNFSSLFTWWFWAAGSANDFGWEDSGAGNQWDKAKLKKPFLSGHKLMALSWLYYLCFWVWGRVCFRLLSE